MNRISQTLTAILQDMEDAGIDIPSEGEQVIEVAEDDVAVQVVAERLADVLLRFILWLLEGSSFAELANEFTE